MSPVHDHRFSKDRTAELVSDDSVVRAEYLKPALLAAAGVALLLFLVATGSRTVDFTVLGLIVGVGIQIVLGLVALLIMTLILGDGAGTLQLAIVRLAGIMVFITPLILLLTFMCYGWLAVGLVMMGLIMWLLTLRASLRASSSSSSLPPIS